MNRVTRQMKHFSILTLCATTAMACVSETDGDDDEHGLGMGGAENHDELLPDCADGAEIPLDATSCELDLGAGTDTVWMDSDGVAPGVAGCHDEFTDDTCSTEKVGRSFGELCLDEDRLIETNPGAAECHTHGDDLGHPDIVSCSAWCEEKGASGGHCQSDVEAQGISGPCMSAICACDE